MRQVLLESLRGRGGTPLELEPFAVEGEHVIEGVLREPGGYWYPVSKGVPSLLRGALRHDCRAFRQRHGLPDIDGHDDPSVRESDQLRTNTTFSDKWRRFKRYGLEPAHQAFLFEWYCKKFGLPDLNALRLFYRSRGRILEVGPGSGFNVRFAAEQCKGQVFALDISEAAYTTFENTSHLWNCHTVQADLMDAPFADGEFDLIIADGVLHHTPDTRAAVRALYGKLKPGGQFYFYVYRRMGPMRRYCDEYIRGSFTKLSPEECYAACEGLTELGRALSDLKASITLTKGIPVLGIPAGTHDIQRLLYYNFVKCFWNDAFDVETNNMVNFDWYHPHNAWQHTEEEIAVWLRELGALEYSFNQSNPNGISVLLTKPC